MFVLVYVDDMLIYGKTLAEHAQHLRTGKAVRVLKVVRLTGMSIGIRMRRRA